MRVARRRRAERVYAYGALERFRAARSMRTLEVSRLALPVTDPNILGLAYDAAGIAIFGVPAVLTRKSDIRGAGGTAWGYNRKTFRMLVEQKLGFARKMADKFTILDRGRTVANGAMTDLDDTLVQRYLAV